MPEEYRRCSDAADAAAVAAGAENIILAAQL
jgi:hypothetical protein